MRNTSELGNYSDLLGQDRACWSPMPPTPGHISLCPLTHHYEWTATAVPERDGHVSPQAQGPQRQGQAGLRLNPLAQASSERRQAALGPGLCREHIWMGSGAGRDWRERAAQGKPVGRPGAKRRRRPSRGASPPCSPAGGARAQGRGGLGSRSPAGRGEGRTPAHRSVGGRGQSGGGKDRQSDTLPGTSAAMAEHAGRRCCLGWDFSTQQVSARARGRPGGAASSATPGGLSGDPGAWNPGPQPRARLPLGLPGDPAPPPGLDPGTPRKGVHPLSRGTHGHVAGKCPEGCGGPEGLARRHGHRLTGTRRSSATVNGGPDRRVDTQAEPVNCNQITARSFFFFF